MVYVPLVFAVLKLVVQASASQTFSASSDEVANLQQKHQMHTKKQAKQATRSKKQCLLGVIYLILSIWIAHITLLGLAVGLLYRLHWHRFHRPQKTGLLTDKRCKQAGLSHAAQCHVLWLARY